MVEQVASMTALRGARGVLEYLKDHRASLHELLHALAAPALVDAAGSEAATAVGIRMQTLPLYVQRELWSAFVKWRDMLPADALQLLVCRFVDGSERHSPLADPVGVRLARMLSGELRDESHAVEDEADTVRAVLARRVYVPSFSVSTEASTGARKRPRHDDSEPVPDHQEEKSEEDSMTTDAKECAVALTGEMATRVGAIAKQLALLGSPDASTEQSAKGAGQVVEAAVDVLTQVMNTVHAAQQDNAELFTLVCATMALAATSDDALFQITSALMKANWSSRYAAIFLDAALLPRIRRATSVISRVLLQTTLLYAKPSYSQLLLDGLLVPLLATPSIGAAQGEAVTRLLREKCVAADQLDVLLRQALETAASHFLANEAVALVFQSVLNMKPTLSVSTVELLVGAMAGAVESGAQGVRTSAKFATVLFTLVTKYSTMCAPHAEELLAVASQLTSVMAKAAVRAIQKLQPGA